MNISEILSQRSMTKYKLSKASCVPHTTLNDICSGKTPIIKCSAETVYKLSKSLGISMEELIEDGIKGSAEMESIKAFDVFKSNICYQKKKISDHDFEIYML